MGSFGRLPYGNLLTMVALTLLMAPALSAGKEKGTTKKRLSVKLLQNSLQRLADASTEFELMDAVDVVTTSKGFALYPRTLALGFVRPVTAPLLEPGSEPKYKKMIDLEGERPLSSSLASPHIAYRNGDFSDMNLAKTVKGAWAGSTITGSNLQRTNLAGMDLRGATFIDCDFNGATWDRAQLFKTDFCRCRNLDTRGATIHPFFDPAPGEGLATFKVYELPHEQIATAAILCGCEGELYIGSPGGSRTWTLTFTGGISESAGETEASLWSVSPNQRQLQILGESLFGMATPLAQTLTLNDPEGAVMIGTFPDENSVAVEAHGTSTIHFLTGLLPKGEAQSLSLRQAAVGPDGNLWLTFGPKEGATIGAIGRLTVAGALTTWVLPGGFVPEGIVAGQGPAAGRIFFTLEGRSSLGCIGVGGPGAPAPESLAERDDPATEAGEGKEERKTAPGSRPKPITDRDRREAAFLRELASGVENDAIWDAPKPRQAPKAAPPKTASSSSTPPPQAAPVKSVSASISALAALRVNLHDFRVNHIVDLHHFNSPVRDSQFNREYSTREGLAALLAEAMAVADGDGMIGRVHEPLGGYLTRVDLRRPVGYHYASWTDSWEPTTWVEMRTRRFRVASGEIHNIRTAYPIKCPLRARAK
jgi:hypothetical protein